MLNSGRPTFYTLIVSLLVSLAACSSTTGTRADEFQEIMARPIEFPDYPQHGNTYLTFSQSHGYQVNYLASDGRAWLWYPGNDVAVPELWRVDQARNRVCWSHPENTYNPVTQQGGGQESCEDLTMARKLVISKLQGDPYKISSGRVPSVLDKCTAPKEFRFDRQRHRCE